MSSPDWGSDIFSLGERLNARTVIDETLITLIDSPGNALGRLPFVDVTPVKPPLPEKKLR